MRWQRTVSKDDRDGWDIVHDPPFLHAAMQRTHLIKKNKDAAESFMITRLIY